MKHFIITAWASVLTSGFWIHAEEKRPPGEDVFQAMVDFIENPSRAVLFESFKAFNLYPKDTPGSPRHQRATIRSLRQFGEKAVPFLLSIMDRPQHWVGPPAQSTLAAIGEPAIETLSKILKEEKRTARVKAAMMVFYHMRRQAIPPVCVLASDEQPFVRARAAEILGLLYQRWGKYWKPEHEQQALKRVQALLQDEDNGVKLAAIDALRKYGKQAHSSARFLAGPLADPDEKLQWAAARTIASLGKAAVPAVTQSLKSDEPSARRYAAFALAKIGRDAISVLPDLVTALRDEREFVRRNAADAIGRVAPDQASRHLIPLLADESRQVQVVAARALASLKGIEESIDGELAIQKWRIARKRLTKESNYRPPSSIRHGGLYPSTIPGYPGVEENEPTGDEEKSERPKWGQPELLPYEGSVEHVRNHYIKYFPVWPRWDANSLIRKWAVGGIPGLKQTEKFAEPVYYVPMYGQAKITDEQRPAVKVARWSSSSPVVHLELGPLEPSYYALRVIAAVKTKDVRRIPRQLIMRFQINDGKDGEVRTFTRRLRAVDQFYSIAEWYFRAWDKRSFEAKLSLVEGTEIDLLVHTIDLHDHFTYLARRGAKKAATLYPVKQRRADRHAADPAKTEKIASQHPLTPEEQTRWDRAAWNSMPQMNSQFLNGWGAMPAPDEEELTAAQSEGAVDHGWGVYLPKSQTFWAPLAGANDRAKRDFINSVWPMQGGNRAAADAESYYLYNDRNAARRAAFKLVRIAQVLPTWNNRQALVHSVADYRHTFKQETSCRKRTLVNYAPGIRIKNVRVYDLLFEFIQGNEELAFAVSQFLPDIRTSEDLVRFLDTNILQYTADLIVRYRMKSDHETPLKMLETAVVQADPEVTRPWMEYLFTRTYDYPMPLSGVQDYMNTSTTRDGTTWIGSWFYSAGGGRSIQTAKLLKRYLSFGGDPKYDLTNFSEYPKILSSCYWALEGRVAGMYPMQIGDVNGPTVDFAHWFDKGEQAIRQGWRWTKDRRFAFFLKHYWGRKGESEDEWKQILQSANEQRHPWFANRSRALSQWAGVLEAGTHHEDFRFRRAVTVRVGNGHGHAHNDTLDLNIFAHGCVMAPDSGQRPAYGIPASFMTFVHNVVEVDGDGSLRSGGNWNGHAWIRSLTDSPGAQFLLAESTPPYSHQQVKLFQRSVALIDVDEGKVSEEPVTPAQQKYRAKLPADIITPHSYVFDVFRVAGGRIHTYCFHGGQNDDFTHNIEATSPLDEWSRKYLRKFSLLPESKWMGKGREQITATWRLSREKREIPFDVDAYLKQLGGYGRNIKSPYLSKAAEQGNLATSYDPAAPRKFTTIHLLGKQDAQVMKATWGSPVSKNHFDQLFVQRRVDDGGLESAFVAVVEPYAGRPAVESLRNLSIDGNENDSRRAVAVQVNVKDDERVKRSTRRDVCFSDGRPEKVRKVGELEMSGHFSFVSEGPDGLRQMTLVGGRALSAPGISMALSRREYTAKIESIDYRAGTGVLDTPLPTALLDDGYFEVGNEQHRTSFHVVSVKGRRFSFRKSPEIVTTRVISVDAQQGTVRAKLGMPPAGWKIRGMDSGLTATDETRSRFYRCEFLGGTNAGGFTYRLTGEEVSEKIFPVLSALRVYEFGPGDELKMTAFASLRKMDEGDWELKANVSLKLILEGTSLAVFDSDFKPVGISMAKREGKIQVTLDEPMLMRGTLRLRVNK